MTALLRLQLRRLRAERVPTLALVGLVFVTALLLALGPRLLERLSGDALVSELGAAPPIERSIVISESSRPSADVPHSLDDANTRLATVAGQFPPEVSALISDRSFVADSTSWEAISGTQFASLFFLRVQQGVEQHVELVSGRLPSARTGIAPDPRPGALPDQRAVIYEVMLSQTTADELGVNVGQDLPLRLWPGDRRNVGANLAAIARIVGVYRLSDQADPFWLSDPLVAGYRLHPVGSNAVYVESDAIVATDTYAAVQNNAATNRLPLAFQWRYHLDVSRIDATRADQLAAALRRLDVHPPRSGVSDVPTDTSIRSGLLDLLIAHQSRWLSATALLGVVAIGALFVAATCLVLVAALASSGRRATAALVAARGAPPRRVRMALAVEALLICLPAATLAGAIAGFAVPAANPLVTIVVAALVVAAAVAVVAAVGLPAANAGERRAMTGAWTASGVATGPAVRRLVVEAALVVLALAGAYAMRQRGLEMVSASDGASADALMVAVPALVAVAAGIVALRAFPLIANLVALITAHARGLVLVLAARRAARGTTAAAVLLTLVAAASVAGFAGAAYAALDQAVTIGGWQTIGAPLRVTARSGTLPAGFDAAALPGTTGVAKAWVLEAIVQNAPASIVVLDTAAYEQLNAGSPADPNFSPELVSPAAPSDGALPAIASTNFGFALGTRGAISIAGKSVTLRAATVATSFPLTIPDERWALVSSAQLQASQPGLLGAPSAVFIAGDDRTAAALAAIASTNPDIVVTSRTDIAEALSSMPVVAAVRAGLAASVSAAAAYAALAMAAALLLSATLYKTQTAYLGVLGLSRAQRVRVIFAEHVPAAILAVALGALLGFGVFVFVRPGLGLATIMPRSSDIGLAIGPPQLVGIVAIALLIVLPAWALAAVAQREPDPAAAVREGTA